jgi:hypothetical protein
MLAVQGLGSGDNMVTVTLHVFSINVLSSNINTADMQLLFLSAFYLILCFHYVSQKKICREIVIVLNGNPIQQNDYNTTVFGLSAYSLCRG